MEDDEKIIKNTQKILNKLISEEIVAANLYNGSITSVKPEQVCFIREKFQEIANDELNDHWVQLTKFANENGFDVPFKMKDIEKYASKKLLSKVENLKNKEDAIYYIEKAIEGEEEAIKSFEEALNDEWLFNELQPILLRCYYEEIQHLEELNLLYRCTAIGVQVK
jgi:ferritin-like protein